MRLQMTTVDIQKPRVSLAPARAGSTPVIEWAQPDGMTDRTATTWSRSPEVLDQVEAIRREEPDPAINRPSRPAIDAAEAIARPAREAVASSGPALARLPDERDRSRMPHGR